MSGSALQNIDQIESRLWEAADQLCAKYKLTSREYAIRIFGVPLEGNANLARVRHIVEHGAASGTSGARIPRRLGLA